MMQIYGVMCVSWQHSVKWATTPTIWAVTETNIDIHAHTYTYKWAIIHNLWGIKMRASITSSQRIANSSSSSFLVGCIADCNKKTFRFAAFWGWSKQHFIFNWTCGHMRHLTRVEFYVPIWCTLELTIKNIGSAATIYHVDSISFNFQSSKHQKAYIRNMDDL